MTKWKGLKRGYDHTKNRGKETSVFCSSCGKSLPRYKAIPSYRGMRIFDPLVRQELRNLEMRNFSPMNKTYACPACARSRHIVRRKN